MSAVRSLSKWILRAVLVAAGLVATIVLAFAVRSRASLPDLQPWHRVVLKEEYYAGRKDVTTFDDYRKLEDRLFAELQARLIDDPQAADSFALGRYHKGSPSNRLALESKYNKSFELPVENPSGSVLLVHGLTDSPYSMRAIAETFHAQGYHVVALRMPGHGTIPSMLRGVDWTDWFAAVTIAAKYTNAKAGEGHPFMVAGHSTGAALLTLYSLRAIEDSSLPKPQQLFLMSPAIGISSLAFLTNIISGLAFIPYFEQSEWTDILPEYDPYKYNSFPVNAGKQIYHVTRAVQAALDDAGKAGRLSGMPRITVFQSLVDATVKTVDIVTKLLAVVPANGSELVLFDVDREETLQGLLASAPIEYLERIRNARELPFRMTLIANQNDTTRGMAEYSRAAGSLETTRRDLPLEWPRGVFSLGHVSIPFPVDDPVYGLAPVRVPAGGVRYELGAFPARGENGALRVPLGNLARLRSNPFFDVIREKIVEAIGDAKPSSPVN